MRYEEWTTSIGENEWKVRRNRKIDVECRYVIGRCVEKIDKKTVILKNEGDIENIYKDFMINKFETCRSYIKRILTS